MTVERRFFPSITALTDRVILSQLLGDEVEEVRIEPFPGVGYSNASLSRIDVVHRSGGRSSLVLKRTGLDTDWTARRTGDTQGREVLLLNEPGFGSVWDIFECPYMAAAVEHGEAGMLMRDLTPDLLPDTRTPLSESQESALLRALAQLHARFWNLGARAPAWLARPAHYADFLAPGTVRDPAEVAALSIMLRDSVPRGWGVVLDRLPPNSARLLTCPGTEWEEAWADLPRTLLHGDAKVANFALHSDGRVGAFDWAMAGAGPCTIDIGWYIAVNGSRLTDSKDAILRRYRSLLESALAQPLPHSLWTRLEAVAVVSGARMLLWSKAVALENGRAGAAEEWKWWVDRLGAVASATTAVRH